MSDSVIVFWLETVEAIGLIHLEQWRMEKPRGETCSIQYWSPRESRRYLELLNLHTWGMKEYQNYMCVQEIIEREDGNLKKKDEQDEYVWMRIVKLPLKSWGCTLLCLYMYIYMNAYAALSVTAFNIYTYSTAYAHFYSFIRLLL